MTGKLSERDKRALKWCVAGVAVILAYVLVIGPWFDDWRIIRSSLAGKRAGFDNAVAKAGAVSAAKQAGLVSIVPTLEMPQVEAMQKPLLRDRFNEQLKKAGISIKSMQFLPVMRSKYGGGYKKLRLQCRGKCRLNQLWDLLAGLNGNPYLVGIEELEFKCDEKNRQEIELALTVSTFVK